MMRGSGLGIAACPTRQRALHLPMSPDRVSSVTADGFVFLSETNRHPHSIRRVEHSGGLNLCLISRSSQAPLWAYPSPWRHGAALLSGLLSQSKFGPLLQKARLGLGSRALREAPPGVP